MAKTNMIMRERKRSALAKKHAKKVAKAAKNQEEGKTDL